MKVIQAFSWANFILFVVAFLIILKLISQAQGYGRWNIWAEPIEGTSYPLSLLHKFISSQSWDGSMNIPAGTRNPLGCNNLFHMQPWVLIPRCLWRNSPLGQPYLCSPTGISLPLLAACRTALRGVSKLSNRRRARSRAVHTLSTYVTNVLTSEMKWILPRVQHAFSSCSVSEKPRIPFNELPSPPSALSLSMPLFQERPLRSTGACRCCLRRSKWC